MTAANNLIDQARGVVCQEWQALTELIDSNIEAINRTVVAGRFTRQMIAENNLGFLSQQKGTRIIYGDFYPNGNIEGSLYLFHDKDDRKDLRVRWAGDRALYMGGDYIDMSNGDARPGRIRGATIHEIQDTRVKIHLPGEDEAAFKYIARHELTDMFHRFLTALQTTRATLEEVLQNENTQIKA